MRRLMTHSRSTSAARGGFTLVEMLVATTLVVLMMLMFAQIYVAAIGSLGEQQAIARNDGKTRLVDTLLRADLRRMSFQLPKGSNQGILPLVSDDPVNGWQAGYFYLSENDQTNPVDDVLQFTTRISGNVRNPDQSAYFGRTRPVPGLTTGLFPNHPDMDDGDSTNNVGASRAAEVSYFVRNGNLYRRVLLLRDVDLQAGGLSSPAQPSNPTTSTEFATTIIPSSVLPGDPSYYKAFDYAAYCRVTGVLATDVTRFIGTDSLENGPNATDSIGRSMNRFGFATTAANQLNPDPLINSRGQPVEYDSLGNFFGRPVHAETGSYEWGWPGTRDNPLLDANLRYGFVGTDQLSYLAGNTSLVDPVVDPSEANYTRATEDLLVANVESFDVEVWDSGLMEDFNNDGVLDAVGDLNGNGFADQSSGFVQLGNTGPTGYFNDAARRNDDYGPGTDPNGVNANIDTRNWVFDTGHPDMWTEALDAALGTVSRPPYRPLMYRIAEQDIAPADGVPDPDLNGNGIVDPPNFSNPVRVAHEWLPNQPYRCSEDLDNDGVLDAGEDANGNGILDKVADVVFRPGDTTFSIAYRCVASGEDADGDGFLDANEDDGIDDNGDGVLDLGTSSSLDPNNQPRFQFPSVPGQRTPPGSDNNVTWEAFDNRVGLQKLRITIRLRDPIEGLPRQFSIVHTFANPK